jgi:hypothetical protein
MKHAPDRKHPFGTLDKVTSRRVKWLWEPNIPRGMLSSIEGEPNIGKSFLITWLACAITSGGLLPDETRIRKGRVLYLSAEDDPAYTMKPRVEAMGGDPSLIHYMKSELVLDDKGFRAIEKECERYAFIAVMLDPLISFTPPGNDYHNSTDIRALLGRLKRLAGDSGAAVIIVRHLTKTRREKAIHQGQGTIDVIAAVRSACIVAPDPEDPDVRVLAHIKHNLSRKGESYAYRIVPIDGGMPILEWEGVSKLTGDDLLQIQAAAPKQLEGAVDFLNSFLAKGRKAATAVVREAEARNISDRTLDRAKRNLRIVARKEGARWWWSLPAAKERQKV